jgi:hypothetical protein
MLTLFTMSRCVRLDGKALGSALRSNRAELSKNHAFWKIWWSVSRQWRAKQGLDTGNQAKLGGAYRDRTDDPLLAKQVLSQLS